MNTTKDKQRKSYIWKDGFFGIKISGRTLQSKFEFEKTKESIIAKYLTTYFGSIWFLSGLVFLVLGWVVINSGLISGVEPLDPYPFIFMVMLIQMFEVFLSVVVLVSQNRESKIAEIRQQVDLEVNVRAENEVTKILHMLEEIHKEMGIDRKDVELEIMKEKIDIEEIKEEVEQIMEEDNKLKPEEKRK